MREGVLHGLPVLNGAYTDKVDVHAADYGAWPVG